MLIAFCFPGRGSATPIIQEVLYDGPGSDADDAFTELSGTPGENLDGWTLVDVNGGDGGDYRTVDLSGALFPADGILVIATSSAAGEVLLQRDLVGSVDWQNGPDAVQLRDPGGTVVDALQYGDAGAFSAGEGAPAPRVAAGESLSRGQRRQRHRRQRRRLLRADGTVARCRPFRPGAVSRCRPFTSTPWFTAAGLRSRHHRHLWRHTDHPRPRHRHQRSGHRRRRSLRQL